MQPIKAIDTYYNGNYFRSRLEARWAFFFDLESIAYQYEPQGFVTSHGAYLPDFYLPQFSVYAEVKPTGFPVNMDAELFLKNTYPKDFDRWKGFVSGGPSLLLLLGTPHINCMPLFMPNPCFGCQDGPGFDYVGFYTKEERLWKGCAGDEYFLWYEDSVIAANKKRFEHGA